VLELGRLVQRVDENLPLDIGAHGGGVIHVIDLVPGTVTHRLAYVA
jgi:hypothetical protein